MKESVVMRWMAVLLCIQMSTVGCMYVHEKKVGKQQEQIQAVSLEHSSEEQNYKFLGSLEKEHVPLSVDECVAITLELNQDVRIADRRILTSQSRENEALSLVLPKVTALGRATVRSNQAAAKTDQGSFETADSRSATGIISTIVPIYDFGRASNIRQIARLGTEVTSLSTERVKQDLILAARQSYYRVLETMKIRGVVQESINVIERQLEISKDFYKEGLVAKNDPLALGVQLSERKQQLIRAENNISLAIATLNRVMGVEVSRKTRIHDVMEVEPWSGSFEHVIQMAMESRPDLMAMKRSIEIARADYGATKSNFWPYINALGNFSSTTEGHLVNQNWFAAGLNMEWPIFDGGVTRAQLDQKEKQIEESIDLYDKYGADIILDLKKAYLFLQDTAERIPVARKSIELAEENMRIVHDQYGQGLLSSAEVLLEEQRLSTSRSSYYRALYSYHASYALLENEIGGDLESP